MFYVYIFLLCFNFGWALYHLDHVQSEQKSLATMIFSSVGVMIAAGWLLMWQINTHTDDRIIQLRDYIFSNECNYRHGTVSSSTGVLICNFK